MTSSFQGKLLAQRALFQRLQSAKKRSKLQAGFTLIELLIVIVIIGILSAIALPNFLNQRNRAFQASANSHVAAQARKCAASLVTGEAADYTVDTPPDMGNSGITMTVPATCAAGNFTVQGGPSGTSTWVVTAQGGVTATTAPAAT